MAKNLVIVESPAKANTIKKYLGKDFTVLATYGHVRDLIPKSGAIEPEQGFLMKYEAISKNEPRVVAIAKALRTTEHLYLATDPDREGEAIAWHLCELMKQKKALKKQVVYRVVFHEITKGAVTSAIANSRDISMELVNAQQARRALDYLVGFNLSPLLWKKIRYGLSAGRVQSPALRMIVTREEEIENFSSREYWDISAENRFDERTFTSKLIEHQGLKLTQFSVINEAQAQELKQAIVDSNEQFKVLKVTKKERSRHPVAPFTTSTLQQEAARKLQLSPKRTMGIAQKLYEAGYITYMRTDSVNLAKEFTEEMRQVIMTEFGSDSLPKQPNVYKTKVKNAQEAHEAIRPSMAKNFPRLLNSILAPEQLKLYTLIWQRTAACQMVSAVFDLTTVDLSGGNQSVFRASGSVMIKAGFLAVYQEDRDEIVEVSEEKILPLLKPGDLVELLSINCQQHFTEPPPRYTEASLIKALEDHGIGRPSTYASIIETLLTREYAVLEKKRFIPTDVAKVVNGFLTEYFVRYVDYDFTAHFENELDEIAAGKNTFLAVMGEFWEPFISLIDKVSENVKRSDVTQQPLAEKCPKCGNSLVMRLGKKGRFIGCSAYPECDYTANVNGDTASSKESEYLEGRSCPNCNAKLQIKSGRYGKFIGCSNYPDCKFIEPLEKPADTGIACPMCQEGSMLKRKSRFNKLFYSCSRYPDCKYAVWYQPLAEKCPKCNWKMLVSKITKRKGQEKVCPQQGCGYSSSLE